MQVLHLVGYADLYRELAAQIGDGLFLACSRCIY
jgi:hypothetical protein